MKICSEFSIDAFEEITGTADQEMPTEERLGLVIVSGQNTKVL
jgi:hypothetical protein